jgi:hypothetical protein
MILKNNIEKKVVYTTFTEALLAMTNFVSLVFWWHQNSSGKKLIFLSLIIDFQFNI